MVDTCQNGTAGTEVCDIVGLDENCDGSANEGCACNETQTQSCYEGPEGTLGIGICHAGTQVCDIVGQWGDCIGVQYPENEICNNLDDNCDSNTDEGLGTTTCGLGICNHTVDNCINGQNQTCYPMEGATTETCNNLDDDCDGIVDDGIADIPTSCGSGEFCSDVGVLKCVNGNLTDTCTAKSPIPMYPDSDSDTFGSPNFLDTCISIPGYVFRNSDCNDNDNMINPIAPDICNINHQVIDKNCNASDDNLLNCNNFCGDIDQDGYVTDATWNSWPGGIIPAIICPWIINKGDCNDMNANVKPGATELCNGIDDNCNGIVDENCPSTLKSDALMTLGTITSSVKDAQKQMKDAAKAITDSLGNMNPEGDKKIIWTNSETLFCRYGNKVFDHEKKAVSKLQEAIKKDPTKAAALNGVISSLVSVDRGLALTAINKMPAGKDRDKAMEKFNKGESQTDPKKKIQYYRDAWKYANKKCDDKNIDISPVIDTITMVSPMGDDVTMTGDDVGYKDTTFESIYEETITIDTSGMKCLSVGQTIKGWTITEMTLKAPLSSKCQK
jgi:hypothetical protein